MKVNISIADVRKVCETLLKENGDVFETSRKTNVSVDDVRRIKEGRYMKSISETYFDSSKWSDSTTAGVQEPEPVQLVMDDLEGKEVKTEIPQKEKPKRFVPPNRSISEETARKICELLCEGKDGIANIVGTSPTVVSDIRRKKTWKDVSSEYFEIVEGTTSDIRVLKTGKILINPFNHRRKSTTRFCDESTKTVEPVTTDSHDILVEIENLATQYITRNKTIDELPNPIKEKVLNVIKEEVQHMSISDIKELTNNG